MMKRIWMAAVLAGLTASAHATFIYNWTVGTAVPDGNPAGLVNNQTISDGIQGNESFLPNPYITSVTVRLDISGGWNGDLYVYLRHETAGGTGFTELLNRVGTGVGNPIGYTDAGFGPDVSSNPFRLTGSASDPDVHTYQNNSPTYHAGHLTGTWRVDQTGNGSFNSFAGLDPNGTWSLFVGDLSGNHISTLNGWGLELEAVPEPTTWAGIIFGALFCGTQVVRRLRNRQAAQSS